MLGKGGISVLQTAIFSILGGVIITGENMGIHREMVKDLASKCQ